MIYGCKGCGKKYRIDVKKLKKDITRFKCGICGQINTIRKPTPKKPQIQNQNPQIVYPPHSKPKTEDKKVSQLSSKDHNFNSPQDHNIQFGIRAKMIALFIIVPVALMGIANLLWFTRMEGLSKLITEESSQAITKMGEESIAEKARSVSREVKLYLKTHPNLRQENFATDPEFVNATIQKVGQTGYTFLLSRPTEIEPSTLWVHPNLSLLGIDIEKRMKDTLGNEFERWNKIQGKDYETGGYYLWLDKREKYQYSVPVNGTNFIIPSTTYMDEFTLPVKLMQKKANDVTSTTLRDVLIIMAITSLLISIITFTYANRISRDIQSMANAAEQLSLGKMNINIAVKSKDEIGMLAESISRMQASIDLALKRMRHRRQNKQSGL